jgi:hypothetical protein
VRAVDRLRARRRAEAAAAETGKQPEVNARDVIDYLRARGDHTGIAAFEPPGTDPPKPGIIVPDDFPLPEGYVRHYQADDDGNRLPAILMFHPDYEFVDESGTPVALPEDRVVPAELAPERPADPDARRAEGAGAPGAGALRSRAPVVPNDSWFGLGPRAVGSNLVVAVFRSIETRRPHVRATTTGVSAIHHGVGRAPGDGGGARAGRARRGRCGPESRATTLDARVGATGSARPRPAAVLAGGEPSPASRGLASLALALAVLAAAGCRGDRGRERPAMRLVAGLRPTAPAPMASVGGVFRPVLMLPPTCAAALTTRSCGRGKGRRRPRADPRDPAWLGARRSTRRSRRSAAASRTTSPTACRSPSRTPGGS